MCDSPHHAIQQHVQDIARIVGIDPDPNTRRALTRLVWRFNADVVHTALTIRDDLIRADVVGPDTPPDHLIIALRDASHQRWNPVDRPHIQALENRLYGHEDPFHHPDPTTRQ